MRGTRLSKSLLVVSGLVAVVVGAAIVAIPEAFYAGSGITLPEAVDLMSEMRAPGGALLGAGILMLLGVFVQSFTIAGLSIAATVYLGYGATRLLSMTVDGLPSGHLIVATGVELAIGAFCLYALVSAQSSLRDSS